MFECECSSVHCGGHKVKGFYPQIENLSYLSIEFLSEDKTPPHNVIISFCTLRILKFLLMPEKISAVF